MKHLREVLELTRPFPWAVPILFLLGSLTSLAEGLGIGMLIPLFDAMLRSVSDSQMSGPLVDVLARYGNLLGEENRVPFLAASIVGLVVVKSIVDFTHNAISSWINGHVVHSLRTRLMGSLFKLGVGFVERERPGVLVNTISTETSHVGEALDQLIQMVINLCAIGVFAVLLLLISWKLALAVGAGFIILRFVIRPLRRRALRLGDRAVAASAELESGLLEILGGMRVISAFGQEKAQLAEFDGKSDGERRVYLRLDLLYGLVAPLIGALYVPLFIGAVLIAWLTGTGVATLIGVLLLLYRMQPHVKGFDQSRTELAGLVGAIGAVRSLRERCRHARIASGEHPIDRVREKIAFRSVGFHYDESRTDRRALNDVTFDIGQGKVTAIVGKSGAGKSTLINLLYRFDDPGVGEILVDGRPLSTLDLAKWRDLLAIAGQDITLFKGTIRQNIAFGCPSAAPEAIIGAARQADADDFIRRLPEGYDTDVRHLGLRLSSGERQRISLARALLRDPEVLILDEATNAIDSESEALILQTLQRLAGRVTILVVAHRLATVRCADHVIVMEAGCVLEQGKPEVLIASESHFARIFDRNVDDLAATSEPPRR